MVSITARFKKTKAAHDSRDLEEFKDIADDVIESDFVPYACLFDENTIATKDGELLQTIKITGLGFEAQTQGDLRSAIRTAIKQTIPSDAYAVWLHTLRRKQPPAPRSHFADAFSGKVDEAWRTLQPTSALYVNELYITVVRAGEAVSITNRRIFKQSLRSMRDREIRLEQMQAFQRELSGVTTAMMNNLAAFGGRLLSVVERGGVFYSEQLEFLEKLINLEERPMPVPVRDLSHVLTSGEITFGYNAMEVRSEDGKRRFAAILTLKEYKESTLKGIDKFLEIPCEVIISQCFDFTGADAARAAYEKQARYLAYSGEKELAQWMEIDRLSVGTNTNRTMAFGHQQTTLFLIAPSITQLESNVRMVQRSLNRLGLIVIREDLRFEECYWAQLPANSAFITRKSSVDTDHLAGFVNLQAAPMGNAAGSPWGAPISVLSTIQDAPYYFNFHQEKVGHTILLGKPGSGRTTFLHFLLTQTRKLPVSIWYIDVHGRSAPFMQAMGGVTVRPGSADCKLNPFHLPETPANREFLALWISTLVDPSGTQLNRSTLAFFQHVVDTMLQMPRHQRSISTMIPIFREADGLLANSLMRYAVGGPLGDLFDMPEDTFTTGKLVSWDISRWMADPATRIPLTSYLLQRLTGALDTKPTLIVLGEAFATLETPLFSARLAGWCDYLTQNNAAAIFSTDDVEKAALYSFAPTLAAKSPTLLAMADKDPGTGYTMGFGLPPEDVASLGFLDGPNRHIMLKRGGQPVVIKGALSSLPPATLQTLSGRITASTPSPADTLAELMGYTKKAV